VNGEHEKILVSIEELRGDFKELAAELRGFMKSAEQRLQDHETRIRGLESGQWKASGLAAVLVGAIVFIANLVKGFWGR
jgi:hypoxanthine-guanine phosphoribosyltransferase